MAINLTTNYSKKLGLPGYSSHAFSASIEVEIDSSADIPSEIRHLYELLQQNVDQQIQQPGFVPPGDYGMDPPAAKAFAEQGTHQQHHASPANVVRMESWKCSPKQRDLIEKVIAERGIDKHDVEDLAGQRFGKGVKLLNKLEASGLIDLLFEQYPPAKPSRRKGGTR